MAENASVKAAEDFADRRVTIDETKSETSSLKKMLKVGFDGSVDGFDKATSALSINATEPEKLKKFYDSIANIIRGFELTGNLDKFNEYLKITYNLEVTSNASLRYTEKKKKFAKFRDLYSQYFFEEPPTIPNQAIRKILSAMVATSTEFRKEELEFKEEFKTANDALTDCTPRTFKTMTRLLVSGKKKGDLEPVLEDAGTKLNDEQQAVTLLESEKETEGEI